MKKQSFIPKKSLAHKLPAFMLVLVMLFNVFVPVLPIFANAADTDILAEADIDALAETEEIVAHEALNIELPAKASGGNIFHAWNMTFESIIEELPYIAAAGFNTIQTSPIGASLFQFPYYHPPGVPTSAEVRSRVGTWWMLYQPTAFEIGNILGTEEEFRTLTAAAEEFGIGVIVDAVPNHTTSWWYEIDESLRRPEFFHSVPGDGGIWDRNISQWGDRADSRRARLLGLIDFYTGSSEFQELYKEFLGEIIDAGATGFRYDAMVHIELPAPHDAPGIASNFWPNVQQFVDNRVIENDRTPFQYGEILHRWHADYLRALPGMSVTACAYGYHLRNVIRTGNLGNWAATNFHVTGYAGATPDRFITWVESHDHYGNVGSSRDLTNNQIRVGWALMTARQGTTPLFLVRPGDSEAFENDGQMFSRNGDGTYTNNWGHSSFYRDSTIAEVNWFANRFIDYPERTSTHWYNQVALIERGPAGAKEGAVIVNAGNQTRPVNFPVQMVDGEYIDQISGQMFTVLNGTLTGPALLGQTVAVIHGTSPRDTVLSVFATPDTAVFLDPAGITVTLGANHTTTQHFTVSRNGEVVTPETAFNHGDEIIIGAGANPNDEFILTLTGTNGEDVVIESFTYTKGDPYTAIRIELAYDAWDLVRIWGWHTEGGNIFTADWNNAPLMVWEDDVDAWVYTINPAEHPQFNINSPFYVMFHNGAGQQRPTEAPYWRITESTRIEIVNGAPVFIPLRTTPSVSANPGSTTFFDDDGVTVILGALNTTSQTYMLTDGSGLITVNSTPFDNGDQIIIGANSFPGDQFTLVLTGRNGDSTVTETFVYTRGEVEELQRYLVILYDGPVGADVHVWEYNGAVLGDFPFGQRFGDHERAAIIPIPNPETLQVGIISRRTAGNWNSRDFADGWHPMITLSEIDRYTVVRIPNFQFPNTQGNRDLVTTYPEALTEFIDEDSPRYYIHLRYRSQHALHDAVVTARVNGEEVTLTWNADRQYFEYVFETSHVPQTVYEYEFRVGDGVWERDRYNPPSSFTIPGEAPIDTCEVIADGQFATTEGSAWRICEDGTLEIDEGFINWNSTNSPWHAHREDINRIEIRGEVTAGLSLRSLFNELTDVTEIEGLTYFDTSNVINMSRMFRGVGVTSLDLSEFNTSNVEDMSWMFRGMRNLTELDLSNFDTTNVVHMNLMFREASSLEELDITSFDTTNVMYMSEMFRETSELRSLDLSNFDTRDTRMNQKFTGMSSLRELALGAHFAFTGSPGLPAVSRDESTGRWQNVGTGTEALPTGEFVFTSTQLMERFNGEEMADVFVWQPINHNDATCPAGVRAEGRFLNGAGITGSAWRLCDDGTLIVEEGFINWNSTNSPWHANRADITRIVFTGDITAGSSLRSLFNELTGVATIEGLENFNTSNVINMSRMFRGVGVTSLDLSGFDTSNVVDMSWMFRGVSNLTELDLSNFDTSNVVDMSLMFREASSLEELDITSFDTSNVRYMSEMFRDVSEIVSLDISSFDIHNSTRMNQKFTGMSSLRSLTLGEDYAFIGSAGLPGIRGDEYTGRWENGDQPALTSTQLMAQFDGSTMYGTWTWQRR